MSKTSKTVKFCVECHGPRKGGHKLCYSCRTRSRRNDDPVKGVYYNLRSNAKRRGVRFALSLTWFREFIMGTEYMDKRGTGREDLTLDRKINALGYTDGNLQVLPNYANARKGSYDPRDWSKPPGPDDPF